MRDGPVEIISGKERRRRWSVEEKLRIVAETEEPGACTTAVAARHDVVPSLIFTWRRQAREGRLGTVQPPGFVPVRLIAAPTENAALPIDRVASNRKQAHGIEVGLANGIRVYIERESQLPLLRSLISALRP